MIMLYDHSVVLTSRKSDMVRRISCMMENHSLNLDECDNRIPAIAEEA